MLNFISVTSLAQPKISIIPQPVSITQHDGNFTIDHNTSIKFDRDNKELHAAAGFLSSSLKNISGYALPLNSVKGKFITLVIKKTPAVGYEGYLLSVSTSSINITANTKAGIVYGMQSLFQTLPQIHTNAALTVPCMDITDYPRFKWRGMHLDVSRHFFSPAMIKEYIDLLAAYKMNSFHWHLCDDPGWRLEIKKYPLLTKVGAWRAERPGKTWSESEPTQAGEATNYGGYYTQEQVKELVAYAQERNVTIIPEIEMPGHSAAALAAYPNLSCTQQPQRTNTGGVYPPGIQTNYCVGNDSVFIFLEDVLTEVMKLFPSKYIHVGGDEVDKTSWKNCPKCQELKKKLGLKDEDELQSYFIQRIEKFLIAHHRKLIGWDEILEGGLAPEATVMSWRGESGGIKAAQMHHDVVMTPGTPLYFDHYQAGPEGEPAAIGGFNSLKMVYDYDPIPKELTPVEAKYVLGAQANVWTEFIPTVSQLEYMVLPRMLALAETDWTPMSAKNWDSFYQRLQYHLKGFGQKGFNYSPGNFTVSIQPISQNGKLSVALLTEIPVAEIHYTVDGNEPNATSPIYQNPIPADSSFTIKAITVENGNVMSARPAEQKFVMHKAVGLNVTYVNQPANSYMAGGPNALTDGVRGTLVAGKNWHGFEGEDLVATIDFKRETMIHQLSLGCLQDYGSWIFMPQFVKFETSADGINFTEAGTVKNTIPVDDRNAAIKDFTVDFPAKNIRYVRVTAKNVGTCPAGHPGVGQPAWLFADEMVAE